MQYVAASDEIKASYKYSMRPMFFFSWMKYDESLVGEKSLSSPMISECENE